MNWDTIKEVFGIASQIIFLGSLLAFMAWMVSGYRETAHLSNFSERFVRIDGRRPYTIQITVIPEFPIGDIETGLGSAASNPSTQARPAPAA